MAKKKKILPPDILAFYDKILLERVGSQLALSNQMFGGVIGYRNKKVPVYLKIKLPVLEKSYYEDYEYGASDFKGWLITFKEFNLFRIGTKIEKVPVYKKMKQGQVIKFARYSDKKN